jgi:hypothetical protein
MSSIKLFGKESNPELDALRQKVAQLNAEARDKFDDPQWRRERAQEMTETIYEGFQHENLLSIMAEVENLPFDGRSFVKEVRGLKAFWVARGGHIEASTLNADVMEITRDTVGFHVTEFEEKMETNFAETSATLVDLAIQRMDAAVNQRVFGLFQAAIPSSSAYYVSGTSVSLSALNSALTAVRDASRTREVTIVGRPTMTEQIMDELLGASYNGSGFLPATNEEMVQRGLLGTYRGASIISLVNYLDENEEPIVSVVLWIPAFRPDFFNLVFGFGGLRPPFSCFYGFSFGCKLVFRRFLLWIMKIRKLGVILVRATFLF